MVNLIWREIPASALDPVTLTHHHPLGQQADERLALSQHAFTMQEVREEPSKVQMHYG